MASTLVDGLLVKHDDVGIVLAEVVLHGDFSTPTEDVVPSKIEQIVIIILLIMPKSLTVIYFLYNFLVSGYKLSLYHSSMKKSFSLPKKLIYEINIPHKLPYS